MVPEVPQVGPGSAPTVLPELLRMHLEHPGTLVRLPNLFFGALMGSADHSGEPNSVPKLDVFGVRQ